MPFPSWIGDNWFTLLQSLGIIGSLLFTGVALHRDAKGRRIGNLIELTQGHREIWTQLVQQPELARVLDPRADVVRTEITDAERIFVTLVILHLNSVYHALENALSLSPDGLRKDVKTFFSRPIPAAVWEKSKSLQDRSFVRFVEACLRQD